ncbi:ankyrin repeat and fibronectin type-III domain-containing protein 1-like [Callorhinchus milii]|uniref:ankyrin repeat and fibronectin type-III domain-containing protein 1-like n=1 Tax=Callorhinchus milii TaxID=7868 RepID=UPI001C3FC03E|nr:ankyrin repeat and fibronectin type-III domain-containing protein 1-like [Callorhinchus milii]
MSDMKQPVREPLQRRRSLGPMSPNHVKRLYRNLSFRLKGNSTSDETGLIKKTDKDRNRKASSLSVHYNSVFDAVENGDIDAVQRLLGGDTTRDGLNGVSTEGLVPLDIALLTNNVPMARLLMKAGAKFNHFSLDECQWVSRLAALVLTAENKVRELSEHSGGPPDPDWQRNRRERHAWRLRHRLWRQMRSVFENARVPEPPANVCLLVSDTNSLSVTFQEPPKNNSLIVTRYRVEWSHSETFNPIQGDTIVEDPEALHCTIGDLTTGTLYYVRVSANNIKGWGRPQVTMPPCAAPSSWKECSVVNLRPKEQSQAVQQVLQQVWDPGYRSFFHDTAKVHPPSKKLSVSRSLKSLFQSSSKFVRTLQRGVYLAAIFFQKDNILLTNEEQLPIVEIDGSCSSFDMQEFLWFTKLSCMWKDIQQLQQGMSSALSSSSSVLQTRQKMLLATAQLQNSLGTQDLGRVYFEPIKDKLGNVLILTVKELPPSQTLENVRWSALSKLQRSVSPLKESTALDLLFATIKEKLAYHRRSSQHLPPGLYLGYLKLCSSVDQIKVLVPQKLPNVLCHTKLRDNKNVSREEWVWLQRQTSPSDSVGSGEHTGSPQCPFLKGLCTGVKSLLKQLDVPLWQARDFRLYTQQLLEFGKEVSFLLLLPPSDDVCSAPGQDGQLSGFLTLPLQIFEHIHFCTYEQDLLAQYCQASILLELDSLLSQQALREAIDNCELVKAKEKHGQVTDLIQRLDDIWRDVRWITDVLHYARYRQPPTGTLLSCILDTATLMKPELCTDNQNSTIQPAGDEGSLDEDDVFWPMDSCSEHSCDFSPGASGEGGDTDRTRTPSPRARTFHRSTSLELQRGTCKRRSLFKFWSQPRSTEEERPEDTDGEGIVTFSSVPARKTRLPETSLVEWINSS